MEGLNFKIKTHKSMKTLRHQADLHDGSTKVSMIFPESTGIELDFLHPPQFSQSAP